MIEQKPQRLAALDGLRAVAALGVLLYHLTDWSGRQGLVAHGYLAVDFFFCLSGFVLAHAFQRRDLGWPAYLWIRIVRIWPLLVLATLAGALLTSRYSPPFWINLARGLLLIPRLDATPYGTFPTLFPFNPPAWSLFFEVLVSALWFPVRRMPNAGLATILVVCFAVILWGALGMHGIETGWDRATFWIGLARCTFSFTLGWLAWRYRHKAPSPRLLVPALLLTAALFAPITPCNEIYDLACVGLLFPLLVSMGAHDPGGWIGAFCRQAGDLSYPLYALHWSAWAMMLRIHAHPEQTVLPVWFCGAALVLIPLVAWIAFRLYDAPVRRWLGGLGR
ncbi:acyltransferase [soil metagenome]